MISGSCFGERRRFCEGRKYALFRRSRHAPKNFVVFLRGTGGEWVRCSEVRCPTAPRICRTRRWGGVPGDVVRHTDRCIPGVRQVASPTWRAMLPKGFQRPRAQGPAIGGPTAGRRIPCRLALPRHAIRALNQLRDDHRRLRHERQAMEQFLSKSETAPDWDRIRPVLDEAMDNLSDEDRRPCCCAISKNTISAPSASRSA